MGVVSSRRSCRLIRALPGWLTAYPVVPSHARHGALPVKPLPSMARHYPQPVKIAGDSLPVRCAYPGYGATPLPQKIRCQRAGIGFGISHRQVGRVGAFLLARLSQRRSTVLQCPAASASASESLRGYRRRQSRLRPAGLRGWHGAGSCRAGRDAASASARLRH